MRRTPSSAAQAALTAGLERDELRTHHQPIFGLSTGQIAGVEALVRWATRRGPRVPRRLH